MSAPSVAVISAATGANTVAGYFEISYFHTAYFNTVANIDNVDAFKSVKFWVSEVVPDVNYEYLFKTYGDVPGTEPATNSLFNLDNFRALVTLGMS